MAKGIYRVEYVVPVSEEDEQEFARGLNLINNVEECQEDMVEYLEALMDVNFGSIRSVKVELEGGSE